MSAFMGSCTFVACDECELVKHFDRWGEAEIFMEKHNKKKHSKEED